MTRVPHECPGPDRDQGGNGRLRVPLLDSSPSLGGPGKKLAWRGCETHGLTFHRNHSGGTRPFEVMLGHDQQALYLAVSAPLDAASYDTYLSLHLDCHLDRRPECVEGYHGLIVGVAGPAAWEGYSYHHFDGVHVPGPPLLQRACWATTGGVEFRLALPLDHGNVLPNGHLAVCFKAGEDGQSAFHYPHAPGAGSRWATLQLEHHWSVEADDHTHGLSRREREVLQALADLGSAEAAAERLSLSRRTVERHLENVRQKMRRTSSLACVAEALRYGLIA